MILVPVYIVFMIALFSMGHVMIVRQALVSVTRNHAWDPDVTSTVNANIPGPYRGALQIQVTNRDGFAFNQGNGGKLTQAMLGGASGGFGSQTALQALNNEPLNENPMTARTTYGTYRYEGLNFGPALTQSTRAAVVLPRKHKRKVYESGGSKAHVASEWSSAPYDPSSAGSGNSLPLNPKYKQHFNGSEGIWRNGARVNGSLQQEHSFFRSRVTK